MKVFKEIMKHCYKKPREVHVKLDQINGNITGDRFVTVIYELKPMLTIESQLKFWQKVL